MKAIVVALFAVLPAVAWQAAKNEPAPIFHVTVVENTISAVNYAYRQGSTRIDFRGTVLMPEAKGEAIVESKRGRTEIDLNLEHVLPAQRFGREYLTYTLWAVTPEGGVRNLAEIVPGGSDKASLHVSTDLQAFGLIVTAEPYSSTRHPSNVVVLENRVRPDTEGKIEQVQAKYELMPRGQYTWHEPAQLNPAEAGAPKVSMDRYEAILELYEAENAIGIAQAAHADQYAPQTFAKAQQLYSTAKSMRFNKTASNVMVQEAREAAQTAEDARMIAERRSEEDAAASARVEAADAKQARAQAEEQTRRAQADADAAQVRADTERAARERAEADADAARERASKAEASLQTALAQPQVTVVRPRQDTQKDRLRMGLLEQLNGVMAMRDTPRGLTATVGDSEFTGTELHAGAGAQLARLAQAVQAHPGLHIAVEGNSDTASGEQSLRRAEAVRRALMAQGLPENSVTVRDLRDTHPFGPNSSPAGREANRRVEVIISGDPIGDLPFWDRPYALTPSR